MKYVEINDRQTGKTTRALNIALSLAQSMDEPLIVFISDNIKLANQNLDLMSEYISHCVEEDDDDISLMSISAKNIDEVTRQLSGLDKENTIVVFDEFTIKDGMSERDIYNFLSVIRIINLIFVASNETKSQSIPAFKVEINRENILQSKITKVFVHKDYFNDAITNSDVFQTYESAKDYMIRLVEENIKYYTSHLDKLMHFAYRKPH